MKKIIYYTAVAGLLLTTSCNQDLLDIEQKSAGSIDDFYKTDNDAAYARTAMYSTYIDEIAGQEGIWNAYIMGLNYSADDVFAAGGNIDDHIDFRTLNEFRYDPSSKPITKLYEHIYKAIFSANLVIDNFGGAKADSEIKKQAVAEARVMRAWGHMLAALVYYQPPLVDHLLTEKEVPVNAKSQEEILQFCVKECEEAMADLPERNGPDDKAGAWIATKGFAQFVAGKSALFLGDYKKVIEVMKPLVESANYALVPGEKFRDLFHVEGDGCSEKIFEFNYITNTSLAGGAESYTGSNGRGRWMVANVINWRGDDIVGGGKNPLICSTGGWGGASINQDFAHKMLENDGNSYRRKATFLTSDEFFNINDEGLCPWSVDDIKDDKGNVVRSKTKEERELDPQRGINKKAGSFSRSDVMEVKMMMHPNDAGLAVSDNCNQTNVCLARLAEAYLIYAEACIQDGQAGEALTYINKIQERAGSETISTEATMEVLQDEKEYELWFEGCRWFDIVRWGIAKECYDKVLDNIPYQYDEFWWPSIENGTKPAKADADGNPVDEKGNQLKIKDRPHKLYYEIKHPFADNGITLEFVKGKHEYWPIPQSVLDVNDQIHQVRGWQ